MNANLLSSLKGLPYAEQIQRIFQDNPEHYADIKNLLPAIIENLLPTKHIYHCKTHKNAKVLKQDRSNYEDIEGDLVQFRCILPQPILTEQYAPWIKGEYSDGTTKSLTMAFFNHLDLDSIFSRILSPKDQTCEMQMPSRQVCKVRSLPGECSRAVFPQHDVSVDAIEKLMENEYIKLYIYDESPIPAENVIIELFGIFYAERSMTSIRDGFNVNSVNFIRSYPEIHVIQHKIIELKDLVPRPITVLSFADTYKMLLGFAKKLTGSEIGARYLVAALASKTYTWNEELTSQTCNLSFAFMNVTNSETMVDCLKLLCPAVLHITITKELLENEPLFLLSGDTFEELKGNHLLHAKGTVIVCDFTKYEGDANIQDAIYARSNLFYLRRLIEKQEHTIFSETEDVTTLQTDAIVIVLMPPGRKEVPCSSNIPVVPLPINLTYESDLANELTQLGPNILSNCHWFLMQTREKLKGILYPNGVQQTIAWKVPDIRSRLEFEEENQGSHVNRLITLARIQTAFEGGQSITVGLFDRIVEWEEDRLNLYEDWLATFD